MKTEILINVLPMRAGVRYRRITYEQVMKSCGKGRCRTCGGTKLAHGPYWQLNEWEAGKVRTRYVGKQLPAEAEEALALRRLVTDPEFRQLVHQADDLARELERRRRENAHLQHRIARLEEELLEARSRASRAPAAHGRGDLSRAAKLYKHLVGKYHPDRNPGGGEIMRDINQLWQAVQGR